MIFSILKRHQVAILTMMILGIIVSLGISFLQPLEYRGSFSVLVVEKDPSLDGYAASKAAERLSTSLGQVLTTASFEDKVLEAIAGTPLTSDTRLFPTDEQKRRVAWKRHIETRIMPSVGMIDISVYHPDRGQAGILATAVANVLVRQGTDYVGGQDVQLQIVDYPLSSQRPARPNFLVNAAIGMALAAAIAMGYFLLRALGTESADDRMQFGITESVPEYPSVEPTRFAEPTAYRPVHRPKPIPMVHNKPSDHSQAVVEQPAPPVQPEWPLESQTVTVSTEPGVWRMP